MIEPTSPGGPRGRAGALGRCARCRFHERLCLCDALQPLELATRVVVVSTAREIQQPTNSGRLVPLAVAGGEVCLQGSGTLSSGVLADPARRAVLLFPAPGARILGREEPAGRALTLVVPDGTWRAANRMAAREPALAGLERVRLPDGPPSRYRLRSHPDPDRLATFEAVARALGILEGREVQARLEQLFTLFVERTLFSRGRLRAALVTGGVPRLSKARTASSGTGGAPE